MARLAPAKPRGLDPVRRLIPWYTKRTYGRTMEPAAVWAHHPRLLLGIAAAGRALETSHALPRRLRELAMLRSAQVTGCEWCLDFGSKLAQDVGIPADDLRELSRWRSSSRFDDLDRLALEYAEGMARTPVEVSDELFARLREHFDERQIVELTMAIALESLYNRSNHALGIESQGFSDGMYCVVPEGSANLDGDAAHQVESVGRRS
jgi:AhpD family alkylhydroperoxidase